MFHLRAQHVYFVLMGLSAVSAFVVPGQVSGRFQPQVQMLFVPVSRPVRAVAGALSERLSPPAETTDRRAAGDIREENRRLKAELAMLRMQLDEMNRRDSELAKLGSAKDLCQIAKVIGSDSGSRESLAIAASSVQGVKEDMYVLSPLGLVGRVQRAGVAGAQVALVTDPSFRVRARFSGPPVAGERTPDTLGIPATIVEGAGNGLMVARGLSFGAIGYDRNGKPPAAGRGESLRVGDYVQLWDGECPPQLQGYLLGRVIQIGPRTDNRQFAEIRIQPAVNLKRLREVMVMTKGE